MTDNKKLWDSTLAEIELTVSKANFGTWFKHTSIIKQDAGAIHLGVPNAFVKDWLQNKFHKFILKLLRDLAPETRSVEYIIIKQDDRDKPPPKDDLLNKQAILNDGLGLNELYINKDDNLNPKYTFDTFIVGSFNELAHAASQAVLKNPGMSYNPLFIYGGTGLGKTHLIQAIGNQLKKSYPTKKIHYITSEKFSMDFVNSMQSNRVNSFKEKYRKYDLLIMDDVQFLSNKEKTQEELFHLFNSLHEANKQIIFSSDRTPKQIPNIVDRLRSRFEGGMAIAMG